MMRGGGAPVYLMREVSEGIARYGVDVDCARRQQTAYEGALREAGVEVVMLSSDPRQPDCCFVEDTAIVDGDRALITRMGFPERRAETVVVEEQLAELGVDTDRMEQGTLEGGDVLRVGDRVFVGMSKRTDREGMRALEDFLGHPCEPVQVRCLHLKTSCTAVDDETVILNPDWVDPNSFDGLKVVEATDPNILTVGRAHFASTEATVARIPGAWLLDISEFLKAEGGLTCLSLALRR